MNMGDSRLTRVLDIYNVLVFRIIKLFFINKKQFFENRILAEDPQLS